MRPKTYAEAGVDIAAGEETVERIRRAVASTRRPECLGDLGGFGGAFLFPGDRFEEPVLVAGTDGVGTKLKVAFLAGQHGTIGIDLVAMCANDILAQGAEPLFFLDYLAAGTLDPAQAEQVIEGIAAGCREAGCALIGGETAEMPGFYPPGEYDLAGFAVGVVERARLIDGTRIREGDVLLGLRSSGLHANGYSLARAILLSGTDQEDRARLAETVPGGEQTLGEALLAPTRIYAGALLSLRDQVEIRGIAHITGGGITGNVPRMLPEGLQARIERDRVPGGPLFSLLAGRGPVADPEMLTTFNMGIGMVLALAPEELPAARAHLSSLGEETTELGVVVPGPRTVVYR